MNNNMDNFVDKTKEVVDAAGKVAVELVDMSKAKIQELRLSSDLRDAYARLGNVVYESVKKGTDNHQLVDMIVGEIDALRQELKSIRPDKDFSAKEVYCAKCGTTNERSFTFCSKCGAALKTAEED